MGTLIKDRGYRQVWRFEHDGRGYFLKFYPRGGGRDRFRRFFRGSPAMAEFIRLQRLQSAQIPAPRPVAVLMGFRINACSGDAVILEAIEPSIPVDQHFIEFELRGEPIPDRVDLARQIREIVGKLAAAGLGHDDLHLGNFLLKEGNLYLLDAYAVQLGGMTVKHLLHLGHSVSRFATRTDLLRGWRQLGPNRPSPRRNAAAAEEWKNFMRRRLTGENPYFGGINVGDWSGSFFKSYKHPHRWSATSSLRITREDWDRELPQLIDKIENDQLKFLKQSKSGDVLAATIHVSGKDVDVIIKRARRRYWYRYINDIWRGTRARRAWFKAWKIIVRNLPTAWPLLYVEKRRFGYLTDGFIIFERVPGPMLVWAKLDEILPAHRENLFRRAGKILRRIDQLGFGHFDAKASNWIVMPDEKLGPWPVMIDIDGIRERRWLTLGIRRLLKSMQENKQYSVADSLALCQGYAPLGKNIGIRREKAVGESHESARIDTNLHESGPA